MWVPSVHRWTKKKKKNCSNKSQKTTSAFSFWDASGINLDPLPMGEMLPREGDSSLNEIGHNFF